MVRISVKRLRRLGACWGGVTAFEARFNGANPPLLDVLLHPEAKIHRGYISWLLNRLISTEELNYKQFPALLKWWARRYKSVPSCLVLGSFAGRLSYTKAQANAIVDILTPKPKAKLKPKARRK